MLVCVSLYECSFVCLSVCMCVCVCVSSVYVCICGFLQRVYCICHNVDMLTHVWVWKSEVLSCCSPSYFGGQGVSLTLTIGIYHHHSYTHTFLMLVLQVYVIMPVFFYMDAGDHYTCIKVLHILSCIPQTQANTFITLLTINLPTDQSSSSLLTALIARNQSFNIWAFRETFYIQTIIPSN